MPDIEPLIESSVEVIEVDNAWGFERRPGYITDSKHLWINGEIVEIVKIEGNKIYIKKTANDMLGLEGWITPKPAVWKCSGLFPPEKPMCTKKEKKAAKKYDKMVDNYEDAREAIRRLETALVFIETKEVKIIKKSLKQLFKFMDKNCYRGF